jgi:16S rRNA A1518/A1519 N6-dimethyltransferase RsmA/KsgA/DIM1 with predicted DNA glycosylase/AP lyase activity
MKRLHTYSQYFLRSPKLISELIGHTNIRKRDLVLDIGAGSGAISSVLAYRAGRVWAIEYEPRMAEKLRQNMASYDNVIVKQGDFLTMELPEDPYKVFANIPFHLSSPIVHKLTEAKNPPVATFLIVQKQFAQKLLSDSDRFTGQLGMMIGPLFRVRIRKPLRKTDYFPHPNVDTVLVELKPRPEPLLKAADMPAYRNLVEACFADPRQFAKTPQKAAGLPDGVKPSQLRLEQWVRLYQLTTK